MMITLVKRRKNKTELHLNLVQIKKNISYLVADYLRRSIWKGEVKILSLYQQWINVELRSNVENKLNFGEKLIWP